MESVKPVLFNSIFASIRKKTALISGKERELECDGLVLFSTWNEIAKSGDGKKMKNSFD